jgi:LPXTG-motif cell wall-anchored protein
MTPRCPPARRPSSSRPARPPHNFVRKEPASKFEKDCKAGSKDDCWKYGTALIQEKRFDEAIKVFEDWGRANPKDKRAPIAAFLVQQTKKHMADEAAKSAAGGGTATLPTTAAQGAAPGSGEHAAAPGDNAPTGAPGSEAANAREAGTDNTRVNAAGEASGANADPAALEGSGSTTAPEHHLGFAAVAGIAAAIVAALGLFFWRRRRS